MRELNESEVQEKKERIGSKGLRDLAGGREKWFSFEHGGGWRKLRSSFWVLSLVMVSLPIE